MKRMTAIILALTAIPACESQNDLLSRNQLDQLESLVQNKQYFDLRDTLKEYDGYENEVLLFFRGLAANKFFRLESSTAYLDEFVKSDNESTDLLIESYELLGDNYTKAFRYEEAAGTYKTILEEFDDYLDDEKKDDINNYIRILDALTDVAPQLATIERDITVQLVDGGYLPLQINGHHIRLGPDTGANYSCLIRSLAERVGLRIIDADVDVLNVAGQKVKADLGIATELKVGDVILSSVVFLIFEDEDFYIEEADVQILGVIGFPVFSSLGEFAFHSDGNFSISANPRQYSDQNLCLDELTPVVAGYYEATRHAFSLDTGAGVTTLYPPFYQAHEEEISSRYPLEEERVQGIGGYRMIPAYHLPELKMTFSGKDAVFRNVPVLTELTLDDSRFFYGNIGRDLMNQFEKMTISFESMSVVFE